MAYNSKYLSANGTNDYLLDVEIVENSRSDDQKARNVTPVYLYGRVTSKGSSFSGQSSYGNLKLYVYDNNKNSSGKLVKEGNYYSISSNGNVLVNDTIELEHKTDGTLSVHAKAVWTKNGSNSFVPGSGEVSTSSIALSKIPRYATITSHKLKSSTTTSLTVEWSADSKIDEVQYSTDGTTWNPTSGTISSDGLSGTYTINNLEPNTKYNIKTRVKRSESQLWTESSQIEASTSAKTVRVNINGETKEAIPYLGKNGEWKVAEPYIGNNGEWKRGI